MTLLASAEEGQQRVKLAEAADLIRGALVAVGVWLLTAWAISQGRDAARFAFSSFFALITLTGLIALAQHGAANAAADMIASAAVWVIALATMVLIFTRQSNRYYRQAVQPAVHS